MFTNFFQTYPVPTDHISASYNFRLVILSYLVATAASYVALDVTNRMKNIGISVLDSYLWLIGGSITMGAGIWSGHFIGMLAMIMPIPILYDPVLTGLSIAVAIMASGLAFALLRSTTIRPLYFMLGGILLGLAIAAMHYTGMTAIMISMRIRYRPDLLAASILIAIGASELALYLAIKSTQTDSKYRFPLKISSAFVMGAGICGMHYTGMAAAVFTPLATMPEMISTTMSQEALAVIIAMVTFLILTIAISISSFKEALSAKAVAMARQSGMAEVASNVLHNVGNVLNSVNVSTFLLREHLNKIDLRKLDDVNLLINTHKNHLGDFMSLDPRGSRLPGYLVLLTKQWQQEQLMIEDELKRLEQNMQHIKQIISVQQSYNGIMDFSELTSIDKILDEALTLAGINYSKHGITIKKEYMKLKPTYVDKLKLTQIMINLIQNAEEATLESDNQNKFIMLKAGSADDDMFYIQVIDNGIGIETAHQSRIFSYGFTTKKYGHGFGLHASIISINEMNGSLEANSEGKDKGSTFTIKLPYRYTDVDPNAPH